MKPKIYTIAPTKTEALITGVAFYYLRETGNAVTLHYVDGTRETGTIPEDLAKTIRAYAHYQDWGGAECACPDSFDVVSAVQAVARA